MTKPLFYVILLYVEKYIYKIVSHETIKEGQMKKILSLTLVALMVVSMLILCSCSIGGGTDTSTESNNTQSTSTDTGSSQQKPQVPLPDDANDDTSFDNVVEF